MPFVMSQGALHMRDDIERASSDKSRYRWYNVVNVKTHDGALRIGTIVNEI